MSELALPSRSCVCLCAVCGAWSPSQHAAEQLPVCRRALYLYTPLPTLPHWQQQWRGRGCRSAATVCVCHPPSTPSQHANTQQHPNNTTHSSNRFQEVLVEVGFQGGVPIDEDFFRTHISGRHNPEIAGRVGFGGVWVVCCGLCEQQEEGRRRWGEFAAAVTPTQPTNLSHPPKTPPTLTQLTCFPSGQRSVELPSTWTRSSASGTWQVQ